MADQNTNQQNNQGSSGIDNTADNAINKGIDNASQHVPGGEKVDQGAKQKADQAANSKINQEAQKGAGGIKNDAEDLMNKNK